MLRAYQVSMGNIMFKNICRLIVPVVSWSGLIVQAISVSLHLSNADRNGT